MKVICRATKTSNTITINNTVATEGERVDTANITPKMAAVMILKIIDRTGLSLAQSDTRCFEVSVDGLGGGDFDFDLELAAL